MQNFKNKVAVVTGSASGIGLALARCFAREGMHVVLADIEVDALEAAEREIRAISIATIAVRTDVSRSEDIEALAARALDAFGGVHIVCNNAGVAAPAGPIWERSLEEWQWVLGVNLWGVIHGIRTFVPILLKQGEEAHIVNTASVAGLLSMPFLGVYHATKHAVVNISEALQAELAAVNAPIGVSVLCPGLVNTRIMDSIRNRPANLSKGVDDLSPVAQQWAKGFRSLVEAGMPPDEVAAKVVEAIRGKELYVLTHPEFNEQIRQRVERILVGSHSIATAM